MKHHEIVAHVATIRAIADRANITPANRETLDKYVRHLAERAGQVERTVHGTVSTALNYINHVGAKYTERGEPHPQALLVQQLEAILAAGDDASALPPADESGEFRNPLLRMLKVDQHVKLTLRSGSIVEGHVGEQDSTDVFVLSTTNQENAELVLPDEVIGVTMVKHYASQAASAS